MTGPLSNIPKSTVPAVKRYLFDQYLQNLNPAPGHQLLVVYDLPGTFRPDDIVSVGSIFERRTKPWTMRGSGERGWIKEDYEIELTVDVFRGGGDSRQQIEAYERAWDLMSVMEQHIRKDPSLGGLVIQAAPAYSRDSSAWEKEHKGWLATVESRIAVSAQL